MKKIIQLIVLAIISNISLPNEVEISRQYLINQDIAKSLPLKDSIILEGMLSFQVCDTSACIPIVQDLSHIIYNDSNKYTGDARFAISTLSLDQHNNNPMLPDWGNFSIEGFVLDGGFSDTLSYSIIFNINEGYHVFTTDTLLSPNGAGNTDIYWEDNDFIIQELAYSEPNPHIEFNDTWMQYIGYHDGKKHDKFVMPEDKAETDESLIGFFIVAILAGLAAIFTPCVFPMIPLTVSFFTKKEGEESQSKKDPLLYGFSIILIFIMLGLGFSFVLGAQALNALATSPIANFIFFIIFFLFALSFFGAFEITLPNSFLNKINKKADQGGTIGIFFMAFTLVLITFSCTAPIVGSILILSAEGEFLKPIIGMLGFSLSFALIFTLTALFPKSLDNLPKGMNLNTIKVLLGFIELALSLKFLSKADLISQWGILNRDIYLAIWIVIFSFLGLYLLGKIKLYHDSDDDKIGALRLLLAISSFSFVIAIFPGMFGAPLSWLSGYLPPPSTQEFDIQNRFNKLESESSDAYINFPETVKYQNVDKIHTPLGLKGFFDYDEALNFTKETKSNKPIFLDFTGLGCENCREMENKVWSKPYIKEMLRDEFIIVSLYADHKYIMEEEDWLIDQSGKTRKMIGEKNLSIEIDKYGNAAQPLYVIIDSNEQILSGPIGKCSENAFYQFLKAGLSN
tara:strand:+ start:578 stop:2626 length:2049 start_codon:yes stop_codon:yes gene_type:complete